MNFRELFLNYLGQTSYSPVCLDVEYAENIYIYDKYGKQYIDLISGVSVSNVGHRHPKVIKAIHNQLEKYLHLMVYGEYVQTSQVQLAKRLCELLPRNINSVYFVNSGSEAVEGALKLAKRTTGRFNIVSFKNSYHGSTHGALSVMGNEDLRNTFRPLLPGVIQIDFNNVEELNLIDDKVACVIIEPIQGEGGILLPKENFLNKLSQQCNRTGALLIFDEIQTGFGRTGSLFAFEHYGVEPDIICLAKALGGGMPLGAFAAPREIMTSLSFNPALGHITTFGGHPVSCAAALASLDIIINENLISTVSDKEKLFRNLLKHPAIIDIRGKGLFLAITINPNIELFNFLRVALNEEVILDPFLFCPNAFRIAPPLIISEEQIKEACKRIIFALEKSIH